MTDASIFRPEAVAAHRDLTTAVPPVHTTRLPRLVLLTLGLLVVASVVVGVAVPIPTTVGGTGRAGPGGQLTITLPPGTGAPTPGRTISVRDAGRDTPALVRRADITGDGPVITVDRPDPGDHRPTAAGPLPVLVDLPGTTLAGTLTGLGR